MLYPDQVNDWILNLTIDMAQSIRMFLIGSLLSSLKSSSLLLSVYIHGFPYSSRDIKAAGLHKYRFSLTALTSFSMPIHTYPFPFLVPAS